ncbi:MAG: helix-turn-helix transcriptional regulator [Clostridia bacterium]|nr:helix-turn-helix transcriptional regulator [Clostridia bacterium]
MDTINDIFGKKLKALRTEKNVKQEELAKYLKVSKANVSKYETGKIQPSLQTIYDMSCFFNVSIDFLFDKTNVKNYEEKQYFTEGEKILIFSYRNNPSMQEAVNKILGINNISTYSIEDDLIETNTKITVPTNKK